MYKFEEHIFRLPIRATVTHVDNFLKIVHAVRSLENAKIIFDLSHTTEISSVFMCFICGLLDLAKERGSIVKLRIPRNKAAAKIIQIIKPLFRTLDDPQSTITHRMLQLRKITSNNPLPIQDIVDILGNHLKMGEDLKFNIHLVLTELLTNTIDHSGDRAFYVCAGAWDRSRSLHITALDFGVGIPQKLRTRYPEYEDKSALEVLLKKGLTTRTGREGGRGYQTIRAVLKANQGRLHIFTGQAKAILRFDRKEYLYRKARKEFNGTCVDIQFNLQGSGLYRNMFEPMREDLF